MIFTLFSPRNVSMSFAGWLPEQAGRLVAVTAAGVAVDEGFAEVVVVDDCTDDDAVLAAGTAARRHVPRDKSARVPGWLGGRGHGRRVGVPAF